MREFEKSEKKFWARTYLGNIERVARSGLNEHRSESGLPLLWMGRAEHGGVVWVRCGRMEGWRRVLRVAMFGVSMWGMIAIWWWGSMVAGVWVGRVGGGGCGGGGGGGGDSDGGGGGGSGG